jgi:hypothetical protein
VGEGGCMAELPEETREDAGVISKDDDDTERV